MKTLKLGLFSLLAILAASVFLTSCEQESIISDTAEMTNPILDKQFRSYEIVEIDNDQVWNTVKSQITGEVNLDMRQATAANSPIVGWSFKMTPQTIQTDDFKLYEVKENGQLTELPHFETHVLSGQFENGTGEVFMGVTQGNLRAEIHEDDVAYMLEPLSDYITDALPNRYVKYNVSDIIDNGEEHGCGFDEGSFEIEEVPNSTIEDRAPNCWKVEVSYLGDYDLYKKFGRNASAASNWMYWTIVRGNWRYYQYNSYPVNLIIKAGYISTYNDIVATSTNNSNTFNTQWTNYVNSNTWWFSRGDANILFTGKNVSNVLGAAAFRSICGIYACGFMEYWGNSYQAQNAFAHEIGHILGAGHTSSGFMRADGVSTHTMSNTTKNQLNGWIGGHSSCLGYWTCQ